ncbi:hypothetical protein SLE2022_136420 [Rubroshorea leprosula]
MKLPHHMTRRRFRSRSEREYILRALLPSGSHRGLDESSLQRSHRSKATLESLRLGGALDLKGHASSLTSRDLLLVFSQLRRSVCFVNLRSRWSCSTSTMPLWTWIPMDLPPALGSSPFRYRSSSRASINSFSSPVNISLDLNSDRDKIKRLI